jgi:hypothetical protein
LKIAIGYEELWVVVLDGHGLSEYAEIEVSDEEAAEWARITREHEVMVEQLGALYEGEARAGRLIDKYKERREQDRAERQRLNAEPRVD